jgi:3-hydroxyacyl-[acyl-carrier-protein] dehydratase
MNNLKEDAAAAITEFSIRPEGGIEAVFMFPKNLPVFGGHFPGRPLVPAILELEIVLAALERFFTGSALRIVSIERAKFLREIKPGESIKLLADFSAFDEKKRLAVKGQLWVEVEKAAHIELTVERDE